MKRNRASLTSEMVAMYRAMHTTVHARPIIVDPYAKSLVRPSWGLVAGSRAAYHVLRRLGLPFDLAIAQVTARSRIAEDRLDDARAKGPVQWVLLGAGLDMFAWRRTNLGALPQFEVDHPATQRAKKTKLAALRLESPPGHRFVEVDFERETASSRLLAAGFTADSPVVFAWLGVTYYLQRAAIEATLRDTRSIAAPGSFLVLDYRRPDAQLKAAEKRAVALGDRTFARWGEPMISKLERDELVELARRTGWAVHAEHSPEQLATRYFDGGRDGLTPTSTYHVVELTPA